MGKWSSKRVAAYGLLVILITVAVSHFAFAYVARRSPAWKYAERALSRTVPNYDLTNCVDLEEKERKDFTNSQWKPMPCINTATSNYNSEIRAGNCAKFVQTPERWGFKEVSTSDAIPGDMIIFFKKNGYARHAAVYTQNSLIGRLCATTAYPKGGYYRYVPYAFIMLVTRWFGGFKYVRYYRFTAAADETVN